MQKNTQFTIGLFKDGQLIDTIRSFSLPFNDRTLMLVDGFTAWIADGLKDITPDGHYVAFDYEGRK
jgi:hypothetical protein